MTKSPFPASLLAPLSTSHIQHQSVMRHLLLSQYTTEDLLDLVEREREEKISRSRQGS